MEELNRLDAFADLGVEVQVVSMDDEHLQNVPFARPTIDGLIQGLGLIIENECPVRGGLAA